jgi:hypothetical protein
MRLARTFGSFGYCAAAIALAALLLARTGYGATPHSFPRQCGMPGGAACPPPPPITGPWQYALSTTSLPIIPP